MALIIPNFRQLQRKKSTLCQMIFNRDSKLITLSNSTPRKTAVDVTYYVNEQLAVSIGVYTATYRLREADLLD